MAVSLPDGWVFTDPGNPLLPPLTLPWWNEGAAALVAGSEGGKFLEPSQRTAAENRRVSRADVELKPDGSLAGELVMELHGQMSLTWILDDGPDRESVESALSARIEKLSPGVVVRSLKCEPWPTDTLRVRASLEWPAGARTVGNTILLTPLLVNQDREEIFPAPERRYPIVFPYAVDSVDSVFIRLPDGYAPVSPDTTEAFGLGPVGSYSTRIGTNEAGLVAVREFTLRSTRFETAGYPALRDFLRRIRDSDGMQVVLRRP